jgi:membrane associated rhomboid family serine protease
LTTDFTITTWIIVITVAISWYSFNKPRFINRFILNPYLVNTQQQYYRFLSSGFLHGDFSHLLWNMFSLYFFGAVVERYFSLVFGEASTLYFVGFYLLAVIVSDVPTYFKQRNNPGYNSLGASGGVAAIIFASIIFQPVQLICIYFVFCLPGFILGAAYLIWSYYKGKKANDNINHESHLYGALFGFLFCVVLHPSSLASFIEQLKGWSIF